MKSINFKNIPNCLRKYRKARGLRQKDIARILNLKSTGLVSRWEKGRCLPSTLNIFKLAALYRTMAEALFFNLISELKEKILKREEEILKKKHG